jgi:maleylacetate reductase
MQSFAYTGLQGRVVFGAGSIDKVADELRRLGCKRALVLSTHPQAALAEDLAGRLGDLSVGTFTGAVMHTPVDVTQTALQVARQRRASARRVLK